MAKNGKNYYNTNKNYNSKSSRDLGRSRRRSRDRDYDSEEDRRRAVYGDRSRSRRNNYKSQSDDHRRGCYQSRQHKPMTHPKSSKDQFAEAFDAQQKRGRSGYEGGKSDYTQNPLTRGLDLKKNEYKKTEKVTNSTTATRQPANSTNKVGVLKYHDMREEEKDSNKVNSSGNDKQPEPEPDNLQINQSESSAKEFSDIEDQQGGQKTTDEEVPTTVRHSTAIEEVRSDDQEQEGVDDPMAE